MSDEEDQVTTWLRKLAQKHLPQQSDAQKQQNDAAVQLAKNKAEMFAAPKELAMRQNISQNVPMADQAARAINKLVRPPPVRQPVQMSREFTSAEDLQRYLDSKKPRDLGDIDE